VQGFLRLAAGVAVTSLLAFAPAAKASPPSDFALVKAGLARSLARDWLQQEDVNRYALVAYRATRAIPRLPRDRARNLSEVLRLVALRRDGYTPERALALFTMLDFNTRYLLRRSLPRAGRDVIDTDGVVYRSFPGHGLQFHPLANFSRLNQLLATGNEGATWLAQALIDRAVARSGTLLWEYYFPFNGGKPPWTSGMAQAVAAQAFARADLDWVARPAFLAIRKGLLVWPGGKPWVRLYSFSPMAVLNAHLQAAVSIEAYARSTQDSEATALAAELRGSALALLPRFDTGYWSLYSLGGAEARLNYHTFVVSLLRRLAIQTGEAPWTDWQIRFDEQLHEPPALSPRGQTPAVLAGRSARIMFWLSKVSRVSLFVAGETQVLTLERGVHTLLWNPERRRPGSYAAYLSAVDLAGNRAGVQLHDVLVRRR
jgi:D-glucuronyl C5-epimerase C-terminus